MINLVSDKPHYENVPFEIPDSWEWVTLGEIGKWQAGGTPNRGHKEYYGGNIPWLKTGDLNDGYITHIPEYITQLGYENSSAKLNPKDSVLIALYGATIGKVGILTFPATTNQACCACIEYTAVDRLYLFYFLRQNRDNFISMGSGGAQPNISKEIITATPIPLPPINEQKRIVTAIEKWFALIDELEANKEELKEYIKQVKSKVLDLAIHGKLVPQDPNDEPAIALLRRINPNFKPCDTSHYENLPSGWGVAKLGDVGKWQAGGTPKRGVTEYYGGNIPWLKTGDLNDGFIIDISENITDCGLKNSSAKLNPKDSVLIAMYGATIGKLGILTYPATTNQACCACIEYPTLDKMYLFYFLLSQRETFISQGGGGAQPNISKEIIVNTFIPLPPLLEQGRIVEKVDQIFALLDTIIAEL